MNNDCNALFGYPLDFAGLCKIYPPKVKDVLCTPNYDAYSHLLTLRQEDIEDEFTLNDIDLAQVLSPLEYLLNNAFHLPQFKQLALDAFKFFIHEDVYFNYMQKQILIGNLESLESIRILDDSNYFEFQNVVREALGMPPAVLPDENEDPRIKRIKAKARYRDRVKAKEGKTLSFETLLTSICCMNMGLNPLNIGELSYAAIPKLIARYEAQESYHLSIDSILAGADSKKVKPKYWIRNLEEN